MKFSALAVFGALLLTASCMNIQESVVETYPETAGIKTYYEPAAVPWRYKVIGTIQTSGNYNDFSRDAMLEKITARGEEIGADAVLILGMQVLPDGTRATTGGQLRTLETNNPALDNTIGTIDRDFDGGYGAINQPNYGVAVTYNRVVRAEFLHYEKDADGKLQASDGSAKIELPVKPIREVQAEDKAEKSEGKR